MSTSIVWFRQDLRLADNPALHEALQAEDRVIPLVIDSSDDETAPWKPGRASRWWLHYSLSALSAALQRRGSRLIIRRGPALTVLRQVLTEANADRVLWNRLYEPAAIARDLAVKTGLRSDGISVRSFNSALLSEPWELLNRSGEPYRVFTPYWKALQRAGLDRPTRDAPDRLPLVPPKLASLRIDELDLLPTSPWDLGFRDAWSPGEDAAHHRLEQFIEGAIADYGEGRNLPEPPGTSHLSPHLHFGELGPRQIVAAVLAQARHFPSACPEKAAYGYLREIAWREFAYHLLYHFPATTEHPLDPRFMNFPWVQEYDAHLKAWQTGRTGYPWVDAGMRELWHTGWMHNRVRMAVASFLTKNLRIPWQEGARWFWDTLVDADLANNTLGWQWSAGCGADAAPFFRIFNPVLQAQRFDPKGAYLRHWLPELAHLPDGYIHQPWTAPSAVLSAGGVALGADYPSPIVDLKQSREAALAAFSDMKKKMVAPHDSDA